MLVLVTEPPRAAQVGQNQAKNQPQIGIDGARRTRRSIHARAQKRATLVSLWIRSTPLRIAIVTVSDTRTLDTDKSGGLLMDELLAAGHVIGMRTIVRDDLRGDP